MTNGKRVDFSPLLEIMTNDVAMLNRLFEDLENIKWGYYDNLENVAVLKKIRKALNLSDFSAPKDQSEFSGVIGECEQEILNRTGQIRRDTMALIERITKEEITIGGMKDTKKEYSAKEEKDGFDF